MFIPVPIDQEPKRKNRFVVEFPTELGIESFLVQTSSKPKKTYEVTEIPYMNTTVFVAGKYKWEQMDIEFIDVIGPSTTQKIMEWNNLQGEDATGRMGYAVGYKKNLTMKGLDPVGTDIESWTLIGCQLVSLEFGENDYKSSDLQTVKITVQPDRCILNA